MKKIILMGFMVSILLLASFSVVSADNDKDSKKIKWNKEAYGQELNKFKAGSDGHKSLDKKSYDEKEKEKEKTHKNKDDHKWKDFENDSDDEEPLVNPFCGDGIINQPEETCDDGNNVDGDGCSALCVIELPPVNPFCGDGIINQPGETCDDGNSLNGDGCSAQCNNEVFMTYFFPKDESGELIKNDKWGGMNYTNINFIFKGFLLNPNTGYTLVRHSSYSLVKCLGFGIADERGDLALLGEIQGEGEQIWLVLSSDVSCSTDSMAGGDELNYLFPEDYLFIENFS